MSSVPSGARHAECRHVSWSVQNREATQRTTWEEETTHEGRLGHRLSVQCSDNSPMHPGKLDASAVVESDPIGFRGVSGYR